MSGTSSTHQTDFVTEVISGVPMTLEDSEFDDSCETRPLLKKHKFGCTLCTGNCLLILVIIITLIIVLVIGVKLSTDLDKEVVLFLFVFVNRSSWNAQPSEKGKLQNFQNSPTYIIITQTKSRACTSYKECSNAVQNQQQFDLNSGIGDIAFNFLVGGDTRVYEGRGWDTEGVVAQEYNNKSLSIAFIGSYDDTAPTDNQLLACEVLIRKGVLENKVLQQYKLVAVDQVSNTNTAGKYLYDAVRKLPGWNNCDHFC